MNQMKQYLLSVYQPDGPAPPSVDLEKVMRDVAALQQELKAAGAWVFAGGLHPPSTATVLRLQDGDVLITDGPFAEARSTSAGSRSSRRPISTSRSNGARRPPGRPPSRSRCGRSRTRPRTDS